MPSLRDKVHSDFEDRVRLVRGLEQAGQWAIIQANRPTAVTENEVTGAYAATLLDTQPERRALLQIIEEEEHACASTLRAPHSSSKPQQQDNLQERQCADLQNDVSLAEFLGELGGEAQELILEEASAASRQQHDSSGSARLPGNESEGSKIKRAQKALLRLWPDLPIHVLGDGGQQPGTSGSASTPVGQNASLLPVLGAFLSSGGARLYILHPVPSHTLADILRFSSAALGGNESLRFILYQLLHGLQTLHSRGIAHGAVSPEHAFCSAGRTAKLSVSLGASPGLTQQPNMESLTLQWHCREMSNLEYLLHLNRQAGRRMEDPTFHPIVPWVLDMTEAPDAVGKGGWRDLSKGKWRLAKGDEQLDFTYQTSEPPHHISDEALSELTYCIYKARRLPKEQLTKVVRSVFEANEYPCSMQRLYAWSPDECIPEFYTECNIFQSVHPDMSDLAVPDWALNAKDFILRHREALESDRVSEQLHEWIDLVFGYKLSGAAAMEAKNVSLPHPPDELRSRGRAQLFERPHPRRALARVMPATLKPSAELLCSLEALQLLPPPGAMFQEKNDKSITLGMDIFRGECRPGDPARSSAISNSSNIDGLQLQDMFDFGRLVIQIYHRRLFLADPQNTSFWMKKAELLPGSARRLALSCLCGCLSSVAALRSNFFSASVQSTANWAALHAVERKGIFSNDVFTPCPTMSRSAEAAVLYLPVVKALLVMWAVEGGDRSLSILPKMVASAITYAPGSLVMEEVVPTLCRLMKGELRCPAKACGALLSLPVLQAVLEACGLPSYLKSVHSAVVDCLWKSYSKPTLAGSHDVATSAAQALSSMTPLLGVAVALEHVLHPLLLNLPAGPHVALALLRLATSLGPAMAARHLLPPLLAVLCCTAKPLSSAKLPEGAQNRLAGAQMHAITVLEGLLPLLPPQTAHAQLAGASGSPRRERPSPLATCLLRPERHAPATPQHRNRIAALLLQASKLARDQEAAASDLLAQLLPLFSCPAESRTAYGDSLPQGSTPSSPRQAKPAEHSGYWDLIYIVYPDVQESVGPSVIREAVATWPSVERTLEAKYGWKAVTNRKGAKTITEARNAATQLKARAQRLQLSDAAECESPERSNEASKQNQQTAMLIDGIGWSLPGPSAHRASDAGSVASASLQRSGSFTEGEGGQALQALHRNLSGGSLRSPASPAGGVLETSEGREASFSGDEWQWLPANKQDTSLWADIDTWTSSHMQRDGKARSRAWQLKAATVVRWRAHREGLQGSLLHQNEQIAVTWGRGHPSSKDASVLRCWSFSKCSPGVQYTGHAAAVTSVCFLAGNTNQVASCDQSGSIHIWSLNTGQQAHLFREPSARKPKPMPLYGDKKSGGVFALESGSESEWQGQHETVGWMPPSAKRIPAERVHGGYSCVATGVEGWDKDLAAGTASGRVRWLDLKVGALRASILCRSPGRNEQSSMTALLASSHECVVAGMANGHMGVADGRSGQLVGSWRASQAAVAGLHLSAPTQLLSLSQEAVLKLWDLRKLHSPQSTGLPLLLHSFRGHAQPISGVAVREESAVTYAGPSVGVCSLKPPYSQIAVTQPTTLQGGRDPSSIVGLGLLECSRLMLLATEDGFMKLCC